MTMATDERESKLGLADYIVQIVSHLPDLLELIGTPRPVARAVWHAVRLVPAVRKGIAKGSYDGIREEVDGRFTSIQAIQQELYDRCITLELENTKMKYELAGTTNQLQLLKAQTHALKTEMETLQKRNWYFGFGLLATFLVALSDLTLRFAK
jgi:hypothetical protein